MISPYKLLKDYLTQNDIGIQTDMTIFEAGFEDIGPILQFYNEFKFEKYIGVEKIKATQLTISFDHKDKYVLPFQSLNYENSYDIYKECCIESKAIQIFNETKFNETFNRIRPTKYLCELFCPILG